MTYLNNRYLCPFLFVLLVSTVALARQEQLEGDTGDHYYIKHFTDENGLPQISVKSIARDKRGNIWLATERGVVRYDGHNFVKFDKFGDTFSDRNIRGFHLNPKPVGERFRALNHNYVPIQISDGKAKLDSAYIDSLAGRSVNLHLGKRAWLVEALPELQERAYTEFPHTAILIFPFPDKKHFAYDEQNVTYYIDNQIKKSFHFPDRQLFHFFRLGEDLYYLGDKLDIFRFQGKGGNSQAIPTELNGAIIKDALFLSGHDYELFWNNCADQAFIRMGRSLYFLQPDRNGVLTSKLIFDSFDFKANAIKTIYFDKIAQRIFLGSPLNGLFVIEKKMFRAVVADVPVPDNVYYGQTFFDKNRILTADAVLFDLRPVKKHISSRRVAAMAKVLNWDQYSILKDSRSNIWCKQGGTLFRFDSTGDRILSSSLFSGGVSQIYEGLNGRIWIGTNERGLYYIDQLDPKSLPRQFVGKSLHNISWIQQQTDRLLWIGTGRGLFRLDLLTRKIAYVKGLENIYVRSLYVPGKGNEIWITTYTNGFFLLRDGKLTKFPLDKQQNLASAHCILEDKNGFFWITTNKGLFQIKRSDLIAYVSMPSELYYHYYSKRAGFNTNEFNGGCQPCVLRASNGTVSFPSIKGLVWFVPEQIRPELPADGIYIDDVIANGRTLEVSGNMISLAPGSGNLLVRLNAPYFGSGENLRLFYKISKHDQPITEWIELDSQSLVITMPHLAPGRYTLNICKKAGFGADNYITKKIEIVVESHWYETWWFKVVLILAALLIFVLILKQRISKVHERNLILETKVNERTEHLEKTLRVLSVSEKELEQRIRLQFYIIASISHDIRSPVRYMGEALKQIRQLMDDAEYEKVIEVTGYVGQASQKIYQIADNIVNFIRPEVYGIGRKLLNVNLYELVHEKIALFDQIVVTSGALIQADIDPGHDVYTDPKLLGVVIHNLIDNALKVEDNMQIHIYTEIKNGKLHLLCQDRGPGMPEELMTWLNSEVSDVPPARYEGLGLLMIKQMSQLLRFSIHVENTPGACIDIIFGLPS